MRNIARLRESFISHLSCPSCHRPQANQFGRYSSQLQTAPHSAAQVVRWLAHRAEPFPDPESLRTWYGSEIGNGPRRSQKQITTPGLGSRNILEGGYPNARDGTESLVLPKVDLEGDLPELAATGAEFYSILRDGQPEQVMAAMLNPRFADLVGSMPHSTFVEALHLLSPTYFVVPFRDIYRALHPSAIETKKYRSLESIFGEFAHNIVHIIQTRRSAGHALGLQEYTHLLDCARSLGDVYLADHIWHLMKVEDNVIPDVQCYNHYMEAMIWDSSYTGQEKYRLRMSPFRYRKRTFDPPNPGWHGYGTGIRSVRKEVLEIFNEMTEVGHHGDEASFVNVILASSRVGYVQGIKDVLKTAWNVDVDVLQAQKSSPPPVVEYDRSSPLYPTGRLLFAIAHAFGTNNNIPAALRAIDFISDSYGVEIPGTVWLELFERSFVLSRPKFGKDVIREGQGNIPHYFLGNLFRTMTSEPFNLRPTVEMHHILAKCAWDQQTLSEFQYHMGATYDLMKETRQKRRAARSVLESYLAECQRQDSNNGFAVLQSRAFSKAVHTYDILRLRVAQQTNIVERLARLLLIHRRWTGRDNLVWERQLLPRVREEWQDFLPGSLTYYIQGGLIQFHGTTYWGQCRLTSHKRVPVRRPTVSNGVSFDEESNEIDDDVFWQNYRESYPHLDLNSPALKRLFGVNIEHMNDFHSTAYEEDIPLAEGMEYEVSGEYAPVSGTNYSHSYITEPQRSRTDWKEDENDSSLSSIPRNLPLSF